LEGADRSVLTFKSAGAKGRSSRLGILFVPEHEALLLIGFTETNLPLDVYGELQFAAGELEKRGGFEL